MGKKEERKKANRLLEIQAERLEELNAFREIKAWWERDHGPYENWGTELKAKLADAVWAKMQRLRTGTWRAGGEAGEKVGSIRMAMREAVMITIVQHYFDTKLAEEERESLVTSVRYDSLDSIFYIGVKERPAPTTEEEKP